jgi:uncharacterized protein YprB with RNaseH-like and TPR domain
MPSALQERLRRLRRPSDGALGELEENLLGEKAPLLPLKERLQRLVAVAERRTTGAAALTLPALEDLAPGRPVANDRGEFFLSEIELPIEHCHGELSLSRLRTADDLGVRILTGDLEHPDFDLGGAVVLDTETTGLAGGSGTAAFLIGIGFVDGDRFCVRQYFMRDYHEEGAQLRALSADLERFTSIVTFNGKMFDVPLLEARYALQRARFPLSDAPHLDLLYPARRLWKARLPSCRLQSLEAALLRVQRNGDVPGEEIPGIYFDYVRRRDPRALARIFHHNRMDILSLAALSALACRWVREQGWAEDPRDIVSLGRVLERAQLYDRSEEEYRRVLDPLPSGGEDASGESRIFALLRLAARAKSEGAHDAAADLWREAADAGHPEALRELAMYYEHRRRDPRTALEIVERVIADIAGVPSRLHEEWQRRRQRLMRKAEPPTVTARRDAEGPRRSDL